jgi:Ser/Thr protein kinase RdoA (MazF antagonist)
MTSFDFFEAAELPVPAITPERAVQIAAAHFGLAARVTALGSQQDANFLLSTDAGEPIGVLKIANPAFSRAELEAQDAAAAFIEAAEGIRTATNVAPTGVPAIAEIDSGGTLYARVIRFLPGGTLSGDGYVRPAQVAALGDLAGRTVRALAAFDHPGVDRVLQWDLRHGMRTVEVLAGHVADQHRRATVEAAAAAAWQIVADLADDLPVQVIHSDITGDNVVCAGPAALPDGLIDFGDLVRSWTVA